MNLELNESTGVSQYYLYIYTMKSLILPVVPITMPDTLLFDLSTEREGYKKKYSEKALKKIRCNNKRII